MTEWLERNGFIPIPTRSLTDDEIQVVKSILGEPWEEKTMGLIDADELIEKLDAEPEGGYYSPHDVISLLMTQPVVEERKAGKWIETDSHEPCWYKCDQCGRLYDLPDKYCPECGAKMEGITWLNGGTT